MLAMWKLIRHASLTSRHTQRWWMWNVACRCLPGRATFRSLKWTTMMLIGLTTTVECCSLVLVLWSVDVCCTSAVYVSFGRSACVLRPKDISFTPALGVKYLLLTVFAAYFQEDRCWGGLGMSQAQCFAAIVAKACRPACPN